MAYLLGTTFPAYDILASSRQPCTPDAYAALVERPFLVWRSESILLGVIPAWLRADFQTTTTLDGCFLNNVNVGQVSFEGSANGTNWTPVLTDTPCNVDVRVNRRKGYFRFPSFSYRYLRALFDPADYVEATGGWIDTPQFVEGDVGLGGGIGRFQCGAFLPVGAVDALTIHAPAWPRDYLRTEPDEAVGYVSGGYEVEDLGPPHASFFLHLRHDRRNATGRTEAALFSALDGAAPFLLAEDFGHTEHAYYVRRVEDDAVRDSFPLIERERFLVEEAR